MTRAFAPHLLARALVLCLAVGLSGAALADGPTKFTVRTVLASNDGKDVDPALEGLKDQFADFDFTSYKLLATKKLSLELNQDGEVALPGDRKVIITPTGDAAGGKLKVKVNIVGKLSMTYTIDRGGTIIAGGLKHGGGKLIIAITAAKK